jgi:hypothetical protein
VLIILFLVISVLIFLIVVVISGSDPPPTSQLQLGIDATGTGLEKTDFGSHDIGLRCDSLLALGVAAVGNFGETILDLAQVVDLLIQESDRICTARAWFPTPVTTRIDGEDAG